MPTVELTRDEARRGDLPPVCLVCGDVGTVFRTKVLTRSPWWLSLGFPLLPLVPFLLPVLLFLRRVRVRAPFCAMHSRHWMWRSALINAWLLLSLALYFSGIIVGPGIADHHATTGRGEIAFVMLSFLAALSGFVSLLSWPFLTLWLKYTGVYASRITPQSITLSGVRSEFVEALRVYREERGTARGSLEQLGRLQESG